jgi:hypothetical protein
MKYLSLIYSSACPNYKPTKQMPEEIGFEFIEINQDNLHEGYFGKNFLSPTLLVDYELYFYTIRMPYCRALWSFWWFVKNKVNSKN